MAEPKPQTPRAITGRVMGRTRAPAERAVASDQPVDVKALFDDTMRRYPGTMARLAE